MSILRGTHPVSRVALALSGLLWMAIPESARGPAVAGESPEGAPRKPTARLIRSARSGPWSAAATWEGGKVPGAAARVQVRQGHTVVYDVRSERPIRSIHVAGTLTFAPDRDTRLDVGLIKIQPGEDASEDGFDCDAHLPEAPWDGAFLEMHLSRTEVEAQLSGNDRASVGGGRTGRRRHRKRNREAVGPSG